MALTVAQIQKTYIAFFNRPADATGLAWWSSYPGSDEDLLNAFSTTPEYLAEYAGKTPAQVVDAIYQNLFGRSAEPEGRDFWAGHLAAGRLSIGNIAITILNSANNGPVVKDLDVINNKTEAAIDFTNYLTSHAPARNAYETGADYVVVIAKDWLSDVGASSASKTGAISGIGDVADNLVDISSIGNNVINGTDRSDFLYGTVSNDTINGFGGNDWIYGREGNDILNGGAGDDWLEGNSGDDILNGGAGNDVLFGDSGNDALNGGAGNDTLYGGTGNNYLSGGEGNDRYHRIENGDGTFLDDIIANSRDTIYDSGGKDDLFILDYLYWRDKGDELSFTHSGKDFVITVTFNIGIQSITTIKDFYAGHPVEWLDVYCPDARLNGHNDYAVNLVGLANSLADGATFTPHDFLMDLPWASTGGVWSF
ncbi:hypothetical protein AGMMS50256_12320 [Betaproteobacteria bacterium]|nr:hypothetical protein AGMMS50256_12320 [Betaproteobacteria bacterium]